MRDNYENTLEEEVRQRTGQIREREEEIVLRLVQAAEYRDDETGEHIRRVGRYASEIARAAGWTAVETDNIRLAAPMHDVGKIGVPDAILRKPGKLTPEEFVVIQTHPTIGARILERSKVPLLEMARDIALCHHEKWDGSGYPRGLRGEDIPISARIVAVCDVYDALVSDRVYRLAYPKDEALAIMSESNGKHFDPSVFAQIGHIAELDLTDVGKKKETG
jgi:putative two-component system response regulator